MADVQSTKKSNGINAEEQVTVIIVLPVACFEPFMYIFCGRKCELLVIISYIFFSGIQTLSLFDAN